MPDPTDAGTDRSRGRVYVRRRGRITRGQSRALDELLPRFALDGWPPDAAGPIMLEIGFGMGQALADFAETHPAWTCVGIEVYRPGIGSLLLQCEARGLANVRVVEADANAFLDRLPAASVDLVTILFPDPWPKKRHHKRRLVDPRVAAELARVLRPGGRLRVATDWEPYAASMLADLEAEPGLRNVAGSGRFAPRPAERAPTRFEARGRRLGHDVWDLEFERA